MKCTELLDKDHQIILRALVVLEQMADEVNTGHSVNARDVESIIRFLKQFEDEHHQTKEESALFPALLESKGPQQVRLRQMIFEHDQERSLVDGLEEALKTNHGTDFVHFAHRLITLLRSHIYKEELALFGLINMTFSDEDDRRVVAEFSKFDEEFKRCETHHLQSLRTLEDRYLRRRSA